MTLMKGKTVKAHLILWIGGETTLKSTDIDILLTEYLLYFLQVLHPNNQSLLIYCADQDLLTYFKQ